MCSNFQAGDLPVATLGYAKLTRLLSLALYLAYRHESGIHLLIYLWPKELIP